MIIRNPLNTKQQYPRSFAEQGNKHDRTQSQTHSRRWRGRSRRYRRARRNGGGAGWSQGNLSRHAGDDSRCRSEGGVSGPARIYCIGRNYAAHAIERGSDPTREPPFFFQKPTDAIQVVAIGSVADHPYPTLTKNYHHEVELVAALKSGGKNIPADKALDCVYGYALGLDMTRRDLQNAMGAEKKPWEIGKSFDHSAVLGPIHPVAKTGPFHQGRDLARRERHGQAELRSHQDDLERGGADIQAVGGVRTEGGRHHLFRHAGERRPRDEGDVLLCKLEGLPDMSIKIV